MNNTTNMKDYQGLKLELQTLIDSLEDRTFSNFKATLLDKTTNIYIKEWNDSNLFMITNNFTKKTLNFTNLERECRSVILDKDTLNIVCYSYDDIYYNQDAKDFLIKNNSFDKSIQECFEGTLLSVFYYNDKWNISTRRCIESSKSKWNSNKSHFDMFLECINIEFNKFTSYLDKENNYFFVIVHHQNKHIVDYTEHFQDDNYKKIIHVMTRRQNDHSEIESTDDVQWLKTPTFIIPKNIVYKTIENKLEIDKTVDMKDFTKLDELNKENKLDLPVKSEGLIVKMYDTEYKAPFEYQKGWYHPDDLFPNLPDNYDLILIDGPGCSNWGRGGFYKHIEKFNTDIPMVFDDVHKDDKGLLVMKKVSELVGRPWKILENDIDGYTGVIL